MVNWKMVAEGGCLSTARRVPGGITGLSLWWQNPGLYCAAAVDTGAAVVFFPVLSYPHPRSWVSSLLCHYATRVFMHTALFSPGFSWGFFP